MVAISLRLGKSLLNLCHLIVVKAQVWGNFLHHSKSFSSPVTKTSLSRFYAPPPFPENGCVIVDEQGDLPQTYGETRVVLLPVHPYLIHAYWELTADDLDRAKRRLGEGPETTKPVLRFYDITSIEFDGTNLPSHFDVEIDLGARNWYVPLWSPGKSYIADLGFKRFNEEYIAVTRSNVAQTPRAWPSSRVEERYMSVGGNGREVEAVAPQAHRAGKSVKPPGKKLGPEPTAGAGRILDQSEIPPGIEALQSVGNPNPRYEPRKGEQFPSETNEPRRVDFTEMCEQEFTMGLSSRSKETGGGT